MRILVPVKRVVDPYAKVRPLLDGSGVATEITVVSIGTPQCEDQLRKALAMGADRAILIESDAVWDSPAVAAELAALALELKPDLIIMGKQATDDDNNQAGQMLAAKL